MRSRVLAAAHGAGMSVDESGKLGDTGKFCAGLDYADDDEDTVEGLSSARAKFETSEEVYREMSSFLELPRA